MVLAVILSAVIGALAARSIVAEAGAHRRGEDDRWWDPVSDQGEPLGPLLIPRGGAHPRRWLDPATLAVTVVLMATAPLVVPSLWVLPAYLAFIATAILLTITDLDTKLIPNRILVRAGIPSVVLLVVGGLFASAPGAVARSLVAGAAYFLGMLILALLARGALGFGDVKLAALLGAFTGYLGWGHLGVAAIGAFLLAGATAIVLLVFRLAGRRDHIPFGPFMVVASLITIYLGDAIIEWYRL